MTSHRLKRFSALVVIFGALVVALSLVTAAASATVFCKTATNPCSGGTYGKGTTIEASLKSGTKFSLTTGFGEVRCSESTIKGEESGAGGEAANVSIAISSFSLGECNCGAKVLKGGTWAVDSSGKVVSSGAETTFECLEIHCIFSTSSTSIGALKGGEMASVAMESTLPRTGGRSGATCGSTATLKAEYTVTAPEPLYVEETAVTSTVLCKTASNPCSGGTYGKGTAIEASTKATETLHPPIGDIECTSSTIKGEVTNPGGEGALVSGPISTFSFSGCNAEVVVLKKGTFSIESSSEGNGTLKLEGLETTVTFAGFHCIFSGPATFSLKGGEMASTAGTSSLVRTGGRSGAFCGPASPPTEWTTEYTVTAPEPLYVEEKAVTSTVLCKTASNPCSGGTYGKGTAIEASTKATETLHPPIGDISCTGSTLKGEVTNPGGEGALVSGSLSTLSFSGCNAEVVVLKKGTFSIEYTSEGNGTLKLEGLETTVTFSGFHCIFSGPTTFSLKGGEMASTAGTSSLVRTGGRSGAFCGPASPPTQWTTEYTVTSPEPLYVE